MPTHVKSGNRRRRVSASPTRALPIKAEPLPTLGDLDALFRGFADPTRLRIMNVLAAGELCVCDIVELLRLPQPTISRHLAYLRRMGLLEATREWKFAHYRLAEPEGAVHRNLLACVRSCFTGVPALDEERARAVRCAAERERMACTPGAT